MATYTPLSLDDARRVAAPHGLDIAAVEGISGGSVNSNYALTCADQRRLFLRIYEEQDEAGAAAEGELLAWLAGRGVPVAQPLPSPAGAPMPSIQGRPVALFPWITGEIVCQATVTPERAGRVGAALARVHLAGSPRRREGRFRVEDLLRRCDRIEQAASPELSAMAAPLRRWLGEVASQRDPGAPAGLCHGDLFRDNVLWRGDEIAALLDFESASHGPFAFDLAVTLLAWCYGDDLSQPLAVAMIEGYQSVRPLLAADRAALFAEARLAALRFTTTRITDYAMRAHLGAGVQRDYRRFLARFLRINAMGPAGWLAYLGLDRADG